MKDFSIYVAPSAKRGTGYPNRYFYRLKQALSEHFRVLEADNKPCLMQGTALVFNSLRADVFLLSFVETIAFHKLAWIQQWMADTSEQDMEEIERFKTARRMHQHYRVGDFFAFKVSRREWGYGRILMDVSELRKDPHFAEKGNWGLKNLMGRPLIVHIYHKIGSSPAISLKELCHLDTMPAQAIMDNRLFYGEYPVIGNLPLSVAEYEPLISLGRSIVWDMDTVPVYFQYGLIYRETTADLFKKEFPNIDFDKFRNEGIGFQLHYPCLRQCIAEQSNAPYWQTRMNNRYGDLRDPSYAELKRRLFDFFGLDASKSYAENLHSSTQ